MTFSFNPPDALRLRYLERDRSWQRLGLPKEKTIQNFYHEEYVSVSGWFFHWCRHDLRSFDAIWGQRTFRTQNVRFHLKATSHLSVKLTVRLTAMRVTINEVSSHLCNILTLIMVKTYLQKGWRRYHIARHPVPVATCYSSAYLRKLPKASINV